MLGCFGFGEYAIEGREELFFSNRFVNDVAEALVKGRVFFSCEP